MCNSKRSHLFIPYHGGIEKGDEGAGGGVEEREEMERDLRDLEEEVKELKVEGVRMRGEIEKLEERVKKWEDGEVNGQRNEEGVRGEGWQKIEEL